MTENDFRQLETSCNLNIVDFDWGTLTLLCLNMKLLDSTINVSVIYNVLMTLIFPLVLNCAFKDIYRLNLSSFDALMQVMHALKRLH